MPRRDRQRQSQLTTPMGRGFLLRAKMQRSCAIKFKIPTAPTLTWENPGMLKKFYMAWLILVLAGLLEIGGANGL